MITEIKNSSPHRHWHKVGAGVLLAALTLLSLGIRQPLAAEEQRVITTIIASEVVAPPPDSCVVTPPPDSCKYVFASGKPVLLRFRTDALPSNATVKLAKLRLINKTIGESPQVTFRAYFLPKDPGWDAKALQDVTEATSIGKFNFGALTLNSDEPSVTKPWAEWAPTDIPPALTGNSAGQRSNAFALLLLPSNFNDKRQWYTIDAAAPSQYRPRLILEYTVPDRAPLVQAEGVPAMHSPRKFLPDPTAGAQYGSVDVISNLWSYEPVFYKGLVYVITNDKQLRALSPLGGQPIWSVPLPDPGQHVLVSESGRLYIVGNQKILVYQLDPLHPFTQAAEVKTADDRPLSKEVPDLNPTLAPAVGADGSLYFVNDQEVYGLNPDLQELWKYTLGDKLTSRVTVGPSGQFVYLLARNEGLITIHAQTGETFFNELPKQDALKNLDNPTLHAPVVIRHPDGTEKIYVAANSANNGVLAAFNNFKTGPDEGIKAAEHWPAGLWRQPIIDQLPPADPAKPAAPNAAKKMYAVQKGTLTAIDWLNGSTTTLTPAISIPVGTPNGLNLAMDAAGNVVEGDLRLLFGADGTLYTVDPSNQNQRTLRAIVPQYTLSGASANISSPTNLWVKGEVRQNQTTTLTAGGAMLLGNGFTVAQGATLTVKVGQ